jgi:uncharacterized protein YprB with RNaseH-like and TPR domain
MRTVAFDLETIANPLRYDDLPPVEPSSRLKDPEKIKADLEEKKLVQMESMGADKWLNMICVASFRDIEKKTTKSLVLGKDMDEKTLLEAIWAELWQYQRFVTFNGMEFDVPVLNAHSCLHRVQIAVTISTRKYYIDNHVDLRMLLNNWDKFGKGTFDFFCKIFLGRGKPEHIDGSYVQHYWDCGLVNDIVAYCEDDVNQLDLLYNRVRGYFPGL